MKAQLTRYLMRRSSMCMNARSLFALASSSRYPASALMHNFERTLELAKWVQRTALNTLLLTQQLRDSCRGRNAELRGMLLPW